MVNIDTISRAISAGGLILVVWASFFYVHLNGLDYYFVFPDYFLLYFSFFFGTWAGINLLWMLWKQK